MFLLPSYICMNSVLTLAVFIFILFVSMLACHLFATFCSSCILSVSLQRHLHMQVLPHGPETLCLSYIYPNITSIGEVAILLLDYHLSMWNQSVSNWRFLTLLTHLLHILLITLNNFGGIL